MDRQQMLQRRMRLSRIGSVQQLSQPPLPLGRIRRRRDSILERLVETHRVRQWLRIAPRHAEITQVMHGHARDNELDVVVTEGRECLAEPEVLVWILGIEEGDLDDGHVEGVVLGVEC